MYDRPEGAQIKGNQGTVQVNFSYLQRDGLIFVHSLHAQSLISKSGEIDSHSGYVTLQNCSNSYSIDVYLVVNSALVQREILKQQLLRVAVDILLLLALYCILVDSLAG